MRGKERGKNPETIEDTDTAQRIQFELLNGAFFFEFYFFHAY